MFRLGSGGSASVWTQHAVVIARVVIAVVVVVALVLDSWEQVLDIDLGEVDAVVFGSELDDLRREGYNATIKIILREG